MSVSDIDSKTTETWYYIIIQDPGSSTEQFVGFQDEKDGIKFLPAFKTKEEAKSCFSLMPKDLFNGSYDTQAVIADDLFAVANQNGHKIYLLDSQGNILDFLN